MAAVECQFVEVQDYGDRVSVVADREPDGAFVCPTCLDRATTVVDSRPTTNGRRRRRQCVSCNNRFTTYEVILNTPIDGEFLGSGI